MGVSVRALSRDGYPAIHTMRELYFHFRAAVALAAHFQQGAAAPKTLALERQQIDAGDDDIAPSPNRINCTLPQQPTDHREILGLEQRDQASSGWRNLLDDALVLPK